MTHAFIPQLLSLAGLFEAASLQRSPSSAEDWLIDRLAHPAICSSGAYTSHLAERYVCSNTCVRQVRPMSSATLGCLQSTIKTGLTLNPIC